MSRAICLALVLLGLSMTGCGTCADMVGGCCTDGKLFYRGTREDIESIQKGDTAQAVFYSLDLPFSAIADTVLLPILVPVWLFQGDVDYSNVGPEMAQREPGAQPPASKAPESQQAAAGTSSKP